MCNSFCFLVVHVIFTLNSLKTQPVTSKSVNVIMGNKADVMGSFM